MYMEGKIETHVTLGYRCNQHCKHCVVQVRRSRCEANGTEELSLEAAENQIVNTARLGIKRIVLTGGEPTIWPDIIELVQFCLCQGCKVQIQTNGSKPDIVQSICEESRKNLTQLEFMIPIHSMVEKEHNEICGSNTGFKNTIQSLRYLNSVGATIIGKIVLTKMTGDITQIYNFYESVNAASIIIAYPHCVHFNDNMVRNTDLTREQTRTIFNNFYSNPHKTSIILQAFPRCFTNDAEEAIYQEEMPEYLSLCVIEHQLRDEDGKQWHIYRKLDKRKATECNDCKYNDKCEGIWKEYLRVYGTF